MAETLPVPALHTLVLQNCISGSQEDRGRVLLALCCTSWLLCREVWAGLRLRVMGGS